MITDQDAVRRLVALIGQVQSHTAGAMYRLNSECGDLGELSDWLNGRFQPPGTKEAEPETFKDRPLRVVLVE